jgi:TRAP-type C4-dicarboxylate transport system substrate-binding protein
MNRRDLLTLAGAAALAAAPLCHARAQAKTMLKASDVHPEGYPTIIEFLKNLCEKPVGEEY